MQIINLTVKQQVITQDCTDRVVVAGAKDLVYAQFTLDAEWSGLTVVALFSNDFYNNGQAVEKIWTGEPVEIPPEVLVTGRLRIGLNGFGENGSLMLPTAYMQQGIRVHRNGGLVAMQPETANPALWEQVLGQIGQISELETDDKTSLVAAMNEVRSTAYSYSKNAPIIQNGTWWIWDIEQGKYVDTGQSAEGKITPRGEYSPTATYARLDAVRYGGSLYIVLKACTGVTPEDGEYYMLAAARGDNGVSSNWRGDWTQNTAYYKHDAVSFGGTSYICDVDGPLVGAIPDTDTGWAVLAKKGDDGKSAYQYAKDGGYTGTEDEFAEKLAEEHEMQTEISVMTFGATGDGDTDDTAALQLAFDSAADQGGNLYIPEGDYKVTGQLTISDPICIRGDGCLKLYDPDSSADFAALTVDNGVQLSGLTLEAQDGFAGVILKYYPTSNSIYPSRTRFKSLIIQSLSTQKIVSYFDVYGGNNYGLIIDDVTIGKPNTARYCQYGMRILTEGGYAGAGASWENSGTVRNMRIDTRGDHQLYIVGASGGVVPKNWVFENIAIQANSKLQSGDAFAYQDSFYMYRFAEVTIRNCKVWDASSAAYADGRAPVVYEDIIATTYIDGCSPVFYLDSGAVVLSTATTPEITAYRQQYAYDTLKEIAENFDISGLKISKTETDSETTLTFSDGTNTKSVAISKVQLSDDQISTAIGSWMDANATPTEVWSKNILNVNDENVSMGYIASAGQINSSDSYWVSGYIPAKQGDVLRSSLNGETVNFYYVGEYDSAKNFLTRNSGSANTYTISSASTAYIRVSWKTSLLSYQNSGGMLTLNESDLTFEEYGSHMEGGLGEYFVLISPNGTKYTISVLDDGTLTATLV